MKIKYVTMTGADDKTQISELFRVSNRFPFAEWGILFSQKTAARYPGWDWAVELSEQWNAEINKPNLSAHLCGRWVDDATNGSIPFLNDVVTNMFGRIQLNMAKGRLQPALNPSSEVWNAITKVGRDVILGGPYQKYDLQVDTELFTNSGAFPLFDCSGGRGQLSEVWPKPVDGILCGYAGGLSPKNLEDQLKKIEDVVGDATIWIDMESGVRKGDCFDIGLCELVCEIAEKFVS